jgi:hypothetical protein
MKMLIDIKRRRDSWDSIERILANSGNALLIHYSCESFAKADGSSPRITSIAVRKLVSAQTVSFSIHKMAEINGLPIDKIEEQCDQLELQMLDDFYQHVEANRNCTWIHWNMRDENYGFEAIKRRYQVLQGKQFQEINDSKLFDLSRILVGIYGWDYIGHPRLESLVRKNNMTETGFLTGKQEADAWDNKQFLDLHRSTLRKVDLFADIVGRIQNRSLKTDAGKWSLYTDYIKHHPAYAGIAIIGTLAGAAYAIWHLYSVWNWGAIKSFF